MAPAVQNVGFSMVALNWREVDLSGVIWAGLLGGYVMAIAGLWAGKVPGLTALDIADIGRRYIVSDRPSAWMFGMISHLVNSIILVFIWASLIQVNLSWNRVLAGGLWGVLIGVVLAGFVVAPLTGLGLMGHRTGSARFALTVFTLHALWGVIIGLLYVPS